MKKPARGGLDRAEGLGGPNLDYSLIASNFPFRCPPDLVQAARRRLKRAIVHAATIKAISPGAAKMMIQMGGLRHV